MSEFKVGDKVRFKSGVPSGEWTVSAEFYDKGDGRYYRITAEADGEIKFGTTDQLTFVGSPDEWIEAFRNAKPEELKEIAELLWPIMMNMPMNWPSRLTVGSQFAGDLGSRHCIDSMLAAKNSDVGKPIVSIISPGREV